MFYKIFDRFLLRWWAALLAVLAIRLYAFLAGAEPPVARAAFMGALTLFGPPLEPLQRIFYASLNPLAAKCFE